MWVPNSSKSVMLYCNPNGGFYEFTSMQNEWVDFYLDLGFNVMLWNYRGFGRTSGSPDMKSIINDGEVLLKFIKENKNPEKIAVHGQSLGGSVAARLSKSVDFVFADRTFKSLSDVALFSYGKIPYFLYKFIGPAETDPVKDYLAGNCYKLISCDCEDAMIPNLASLKSGITFCLKFSQNFTGNSIKKIPSFYKNSENFNGLVDVLVKIIKKNKVRDEESPEVDVIGALCNLEVFGRSLYKVCKKKDLKIELILWLCTICIWPENIKIINSALDDIESSLVEFQESPDALLLKSLHKYIKELINDEVQDIDLENFSAGKVLNLNCGHNGTFAPYEMYQYKLHLKAANLIPK